MPLILETAYILGAIGSVFLLAFAIVVGYSTVYLCVQNRALTFWLAYESYSDRRKPADGAIRMLLW